MNKVVRNLKPGIFVISLDYELMWGLIDLESANQYKESNVRNVPGVVESMVALFEKYDVKATFATVGMLMCDNKDELLRFAPALKPQYSNANLSPYGNYLSKLGVKDKEVHFAPESIRLLKSSYSIEIGSHTFCHYYCWEDGQTIEQFEEDIKAAVAVAKVKGIDIKSIIFPRNNVNEDYLKICKKYGIESYRGNALRYYNKTRGRIHELYNRVCRFVDSYIPISGFNSYKLDEQKKSCDSPLNIPASRFFRPYNKRLSLLEPLKVLRIKNEIKYAARHGEVYHLWWHPHNFGANIEQNLKELETVLKCYQYCSGQYGMQSFSMKELKDYIQYDKD